MPRHHARRWRIALVAVLLAFPALPALAEAQLGRGRHAQPRPGERPPARVAATSSDSLPRILGVADQEVDPLAGVRRFTSRADSLEWEAARTSAARARGLHVVISLFDRQLAAMYDDDTLMTAPIAVGKDSVLEYAGRRWVFKTPRGERTVVRKDSLPVWIPPLWHYAEVAKERGLELRDLPRERPVRLTDGRRLTVRFGIAGVIGADSVFLPLPTDEEIVFDNTIFVPPLGSKNREIEGELGRFRLDLGNGYLLHGTPHLETIGRAATHGCIRLRDDDIAWLYEFVPVGTRVYIY